MLLHVLKVKKHKTRDWFALQHMGKQQDSSQNTENDNHHSRPKCECKNGKRW